MKTAIFQRDLLAAREGFQLLIRHLDVGDAEDRLDRFGKDFRMRRERVASACSFTLIFAEAAHQRVIADERMRECGAEGAHDRGVREIALQA